MQEEYTVGAWAEIWFARNAGKWRASTEGGYRNLIYRHIVPGVGKIKLAELKPHHISAFYKALAESGLGSRSIWCVHLLLRHCLDDACKDGFLDVNPADLCEVPTSERRPAMRVRSGQIRRYLDAAECEGVLPIIYIGLNVGLRQCELFTLLWADFNLQHRYILRGKRLLTLDEQAVSLLTAEHKWHPDIPHAFLNPKTGEPFRLHEFYYLHRKLLEQARMPKLGFRDLQTQCMEGKL